MTVPPFRRRMGLRIAGANRVGRIARHQRRVPVHLRSEVFRPVHAGRLTTMVAEAQNQLVSSRVGSARVVQRICGLDGLWQTAAQHRTSRNGHYVSPVINIPSTVTAP